MYSYGYQVINQHHLQINHHTIKIIQAQQLLNQTLLPYCLCSSVSCLIHIASNTSLNKILIYVKSSLAVDIFLPNLSAAEQTSNPFHIANTNPIFNTWSLRLYLNLSIYILESNITRLFNSDLKILVYIIERMF